MPHLHLSYCPAPGKAPDAPSLARTLTELTAQHLNKVAALPAVELHPQDPTLWFIGAEPLSLSDLGSFTLQIKVTQGSNAPAQISAYIEAAHSAMQAALGALHEASYVVVQEVPAAHWGYGGRSQAGRRAANPVA